MFKLKIEVTMYVKMANIRDEEWKGLPGPTID